MITLLFAWLIALVFAFDSSFEPYQSLQLSSNSSLLTQNSINPYTFASTAGKQFEIQMEIKQLQPISIGQERKSELLQYGDVISMTVPGEALNGITDPTKLNISQMINYVNNLTGVPPFGGYVNTVEIVESKKEEIIGSTTRLRLAQLANSKAIKITSIEEAESDDISSESEAGVACDSSDCKGKSRNTLLDTWNFILNGVPSPVRTIIRSIEDVVSNFEKSEFNRKLQAKLGIGYKVRTGSTRTSGRTVIVKDGVKSPANRKCLRGVKEALLQSGAVNKYLAGEKAKHFGGVLEKEGFVNLMKTDYKSKIKSPHDAPEGAVLVYSGGPAGHAEIKTKSGGFASDYFSKEPRTGTAKNGLHGKGRRLIGVYIKGTAEINNFLAMNK